jgi:hypothetical protein
MKIGDEPVNEDTADRTQRNEPRRDSFGYMGARSYIRETRFRVVDGPTKSERMVERLRAIESIEPRARRVAKKIWECAEDIRRCGASQMCPRCARRAGKRRQRAIEQMLMPRIRYEKHWFLTLEVGADSIDEGRKLLRAALRVLRRRKPFSSVRWARGQIEFAPWDGAHQWNVHAHLMVCTSRGQLDVEAIAGDWREIVGDAQLPGAVHCRQVEVYAPKGGTFCRGAEGRELLRNAHQAKGQEQARPLAGRAYERAVCRGGSRRSEPSLGDHDRPKSQIEACLSLGRWP